MLTASFRRRIKEQTQYIVKHEETPARTSKYPEHVLLVCLNKNLDLL